MKSPRHIAGRSVPVERWLGRQRVVAACAAAALCALLGWTAVRHATDPRAMWMRSDRVAVKVLSVGDDGSLTVAYEKDPTRTATVRLLGVSLDGAFMQDARRRLMEATAGPATAAFDPHHRLDADGRLAVYLHDGRGELLNEAVLHEGWAKATNEPHVLRDWFIKKQGQVKRRRVGVWSGEKP